MRNNEEQLQVFKIGLQMKEHGIEGNLLLQAMRAALEYRGIFTLLTLWADEELPAERAEILSDLQHELEDLADAPVAPKKLDYLEYKDLEALSEQLIKFKLELRTLVEEYGGINKLARETGIAQPYLSKLFNSGIKPRARTLRKICDALNIEAPKMKYMA